jgi:glycosyltransferase involved in cell wall biosynthesis
MTTVSCIMPTHNRRPFVGQAVAQFLAQDYPARELIVVDDGDDAISDLLSCDSRIQIIRRHQRTSIGAKRNLACEAAAGEVIVHWDDDDWMADWRLSYQVRTLQQQSADVCGLSRLYFHDEASSRAWIYTYPPHGQPWLAGGTLCYPKATWRNLAFQDIDEGEDTTWLRAIPHPRLIALDNAAFYIARVHPGNTSRRPTERPPFAPCRLDNIQQIVASKAAWQLR